MRVLVCAMTASPRQGMIGPNRYRPLTKHYGVFERYAGTRLCANLIESRQVQLGAKPSVRGIPNIGRVGLTRRRVNSSVISASQPVHCYGP